MAIYGLQAVRLNKSGHRVTHVLWERFGTRDQTDLFPVEVGVLHAVHALARGDRIHLLLKANAREFRLGPEFHAVVYPGGDEGITIDDYGLRDLPSF